MFYVSMIFFAFLREIYSLCLSASAVKKSNTNPPAPFEKGD